jgi:hypothetical protein
MKPKVDFKVKNAYVFIIRIHHSVHIVVFHLLVIGCIKLRKYHSECEIGNFRLINATALYYSVHFGFQKLFDDLELKEQEAMKLEGILRNLPPDAETQSLEANLAGVRTRIVTLMSQTEQGKTTVEVMYSEANMLSECRV